MKKEIKREASLTMSLKTHQRKFRKSVVAVEGYGNLEIKPKEISKRINQFEREVL